MKRKVRIYKDPFGNGGYINKTAQWLRKAQDGIESGATPVTQGIMQQMQSGQPQQTMQQQPQQDSQEQILQLVVTLAQQGKGEDEIKDYLLQNVYGFDKSSQEYAQYEPQILEFVSAVFERSAPEEEEQEVTNEPIADVVADTSVEDTSEEDGNYDQMINDIIYDDEDQEARYGGVPNKRSYVNKLIRKLKRAQEGGDQVEEANTADVRGTEDNPTAPPGNKNMFVAGVKGQAQDHFLKKQAEEMYNNQFGQGMPQQGMQQPQGDMDFAQRGGFRMRRANRKMFGTPNLPMGVTSSKYSFGPLGGVRSAEMQFNPLMMASMFPMMTFPGMGGGSSWGYNQPYKKTSKGRLVTERIASNVNNESIQDVANATNSEAASNATAGPCTEDQVKDPKSPCYDPIYTGEGPRATNQTPVSGTTPNTGGTGIGTAPAPIDGARQATELRNKKDKWGRSPADKWYGFDPATKKWTLTAAPDWYKEPSKKSRWSNVTMKKDSWGRNEDSKWYGYDPKKKKYTEGSNKGKTITQVKNKLEDKANKELIKTFGPEIKEQIEYDSWNKNASGTDKVLQLLGFGPSDPSLHGGFTGDDDLSYVVPGLKGPSQAINFALKNPNLLGQGTKGALNAGQKLLNPGQRLLNPGQRLLNPGQGLLEAPAGTQFVLPFATGGFVNNPMQDQFGNLQKFIYGDQVDDQMLENLYQPPINQSDLDYTDSKDTTDAFFRQGGLYRFQGTGDSQTNPSNTGKTYTQEELDELLTEKQKTWETDYQNKNKTAQQKQQELQMQQMQKMQQYGNPMGYGVSGYGYRGAPMGGFGGYGGPGLLGAAGRLAGSFVGGRQSQFSPVGNPLQYAATAAGITNSGMLPTGMKYSKEKSEGLLGKLGLKHDKTWTLDYATPDQIKAGAIPGAAGANAQPGTTSGANQSTSNMSGRDRRIARRDERLNRGIPAESDAYAFTGTLKGSTEPQGPSKSAEQELKRFQDSQKARGLVIDPKTQKWVKGETQNTSVTNTSSGMTSSQGADIPGAPVNLSNTQPVSAGTQSAGTAGKSAEEIKRAYQAGTSTPTVVKKGNTTIINAAGESIDASEYAYGGYIPNYMAYGGYIPEADQGINFSSVAYGPNSITQPGGIGQGQTGPCTEEEVKDPNSPCYDPAYAGLGPRVPDEDKGPQTAQLKFKEEKGPAGQKAANIMGSALDAGALLADDMNYFTENRTKYIPGMTEFARGEKQSANERIEKGQWNARTGKEGIQGFEGVIKKGGAIKNKKSNASGHKIDMNDFQSLLKLAGLI